MSADLGDADWLLEMAIARSDDAYNASVAAHAWAEARPW